MALEDLKNDIIARLPEMRAEHERLGRLIEAAEAFAGAAAEDGTDTPSTPTPERTASRSPIRSDEFFGMNTHEAVKAYLAHMGRGNPQSPKQITNALLAGGYSNDRDKTYVNITSALKRMGGRDVVQVKHGKWGLSSWYGAGAVKKKDGKKGEGEGNGAAT